MNSIRSTRALLVLCLFAALLFPLAGCGGSSGSGVGGGSGGTDDGGAAAPTNWDEIVWDQDQWQ